MKVDDRYARYVFVTSALNIALWSRIRRVCDEFRCFVRLSLISGPADRTGVVVRTGERQMGAVIRRMFRGGGRLSVGEPKLGER